MGLSVLEHTFDGSYTFDLAFALGYDKQSDITAEVDTGDTFAVAAEFDFLTDNQIVITSPSDLEIGDTVRLLRTVSKTDAAVDVTQPSQLTRDAVQKLYLQSMYVMHEVLDGRVTDVSEINSEVLTIVTTAVTTAIEQSGLVAAYKFPVYLSGPADGEVLSVNGAQLLLDDVNVNVSVNPSNVCEVLISDNEKVVYSFDVGTDGTVTETYRINDPSVINEGVLTRSIVGNDYATGMELQVAVIGTATEFLDFATEFPDFLTIYTDALT